MRVQIYKVEGKWVTEPEYDKTLGKDGIPLVGR